MQPVPLSLELTEDHPAYQWAKRQSDAVGAIGHIGTHIDCYTREPEEAFYRVETIVLDCRSGMPAADDINQLNLSGKALVLYTANLECNGYGNDVYAKTSTVLESHVLDQILMSSPAFIVIDSYGIGGHGGEHQMFDKRCEKHGCFVIENITLTESVAEQLTQLEITIDKTIQSSGKRVDVKAILKH
ncbi:hypothetical protein GCM10023116_31380 [Kistimonas scapharcae]|uniref:Cyclase n=1 Tax=Kistimonas scapharcae TaxID=1036133 RepID=A0ABP8V738_9GAMM